MAEFDRLPDLIITFAICATVLLLLVVIAEHLDGKKAHGSSRFIAPAPPPPRPDRLAQRVARARARYEAMSAEQKAEHDRAQRDSWVRGMKARCEHGVADFEQCPACRERLEGRS